MATSPSPTAAILLIIVSFWSYQQEQQSPVVSSSNKERCVIQGSVTSIPTGQALKNARVYLTAPDKYKTLYSALTDSTGKFDLEDVEPGDYQLRVDKAGHSDPIRNCDSEAIQADDVVHLVSGQKLSDLKLQLVAPAVVTGTIFDPKGEPVAGAEVETVRFYSYKGDRKLTYAGRSETDDRGQFRIYHLSPGRYYVRVSSARNFENEADEAANNSVTRQEQGFLPIYYPDTTDLSRAVLLDLRPGEELSQIDLTVHLTHALKVSGRVVSGLTGEPFGHGSVSIQPMPPAISENSSTGWSTDEEDSSFEIPNLVPGKYLLSASAFTLPARQMWNGEREIELGDSNLKDVEIRVFIGYDIHGRVDSLSEKKIDPKHMQVQLHPQNASVGRMAFANVRPDGTFLITDVSQGTYDIEFAGLPEGYFLKSAMQGTVDVTNGLRVSAEAVAPPLLLEPGPSGADVEGIVSDSTGKRACSATVALIPDGPWRSRHFLYQEADVDRTGRYILRGVKPGHYKLFAFDDADNFGYLDPDSLAIYENQGQPVHLDAGDRKTVPLVLIVVGTKNP